MRRVQARRSNMYTFCVTCVLGTRCKAIQDAKSRPVLMNHLRWLSSDLEP